MKNETEIGDPRIRRPIPERRRPLSVSEYEWNDPQLDAAMRRLKLKE